MMMQGTKLLSSGAWSLVLLQDLLLPDQTNTLVNNHAVTVQDVAVT